jgi:ubiquinone/menaquinone biosynthesis C-methylase UbiE/DNA-binding transcriptional ArsR family regulator
MQRTVEILRAMGEDTRMRILVILSHGELAASELSQVLAQSQPRVSRHLKLLVDAGLVERKPEGAWVFFRLAESGLGGRLLAAVLEGLDRDDAVTRRDHQRLAQIHGAREAQAQAYFEAAAPEWEALRRLHQPEQAVEAAMLALAAGRGFARHIDLGSGTGRLLELFARQARTREGVDSSRQMLAVARARMDQLDLSGLSLRQADILALPHASGSADLVTLHQVLHFLADPSLALREAGRVLSDDGLLLVADFAPHGFEELRERHAHRRLGISVSEFASWCEAAGLSIAETRHVSAEQQGLAVNVWAVCKANANQANRTAA